METDQMPCAIQSVPKQLYVNSEMSMRKTSDLQKELMLEQVYRSKYNKFLNSKEGKGYYLGLMPSSDKKKKPIADRRGSQVSLDNTISYPKEAKTN